MKTDVVKFSQLAEEKGVQLQIPSNPTKPTVVNQVAAYLRQVRSGSEKDAEAIVATISGDNYDEAVVLTHIDAYYETNPLPNYSNQGQEITDEMQEVIDSDMTINDKIRHLLELKLNKNRICKVLNLSGRSRIDNVIKGDKNRAAKEGISATDKEILKKAKAYIAAGGQL